MLKKDYKISTSREYSFIYKTGKKITGKNMIMFFTENHKPYNRFGIVTSKKVGNAVKRNRAKRQLREVINKSRDSWKKGYDIIVIARASITSASFAMLENEFVYISKRAKLC